MTASHRPVRNQIGQSVVKPRTSAADESVLIRQAQAGDQRAFADLMEVHQHEVFTLAMRLVADRELAADITQEALVRAWRALPSFRGDARLSTWLHRITVNTAFSTGKRWRRGPTVPLDSGPEPELRSIGPERAGLSTHMSVAISDALMRLSESERVVVVLKDIYEWSHPEIAAHLGISVTASKVRSHRGRNHLRTWLEQDLWSENEEGT